MKDELTSPTISTKAVFLTAVVDAWENRKVAVLDMPGAFMQVDMDELVHVHFMGKWFNRNMSKSKGWTLQSSLLTLWMEKTRVNNQTKIGDNANLLKTL